MSRKRPEKQMAPCLNLIFHFQWEKEDVLESLENNPRTDEDQRLNQTWLKLLNILGHGKWLEEGRSIMLDRKVSGHMRGRSELGGVDRPCVCKWCCWWDLQSNFQVLLAVETRAREPGVCHVQRGQFFMPTGHCACCESARAMLGSASCFYV